MGTFVRVTFIVAAAIVAVAALVFILKLLLVAAIVAALATGAAFAIRGVQRRFRRRRLGRVTALTARL